MDPRRHPALGAMLLAITLAGCAVVARPSPPPPPPPPVVARPPPPPPPPPPTTGDALTFGDEANGTGLTLHPGQKLILRLPGESPSTGYGWRILGGLGPHVGLIDRTSVPDLPPPPPGQPAMVGGGGTAVYRFVADRPGPALLRLGLFPPGHGRPAARVFRLRVMVAAIQ